MNNQNNNKKSNQIIRSAFSNKYLLLKILKYVNQENRYYIEINSLMKPKMQSIDTRNSNYKIRLNAPHGTSYFRPFPFERYELVLRSTPLYKIRYSYSDIESVEWMLKNRYYGLLLEKFRRKQFLLYNENFDLRELCVFRPSEEDLFINSTINSEELNSRFHQQLSLFKQLYLCICSKQSTPHDFTTNHIYLLNLLQNDTNIDLISFIINQGVCVTLHHLEISLSKKRLDVFKLLATTVKKRRIRYDSIQFDKIHLWEFLICATKLDKPSDTLDIIRFTLKKLGYLYISGGPSYIINIPKILTSLLATNSVQIISEVNNFCKLKLDRFLLEEYLNNSTPLNASAVLEVFNFCMEQICVEKISILRITPNSAIDNEEDYEILKSICQKSNISLIVESNLLQTTNMETNTESDIIVINISSMKYGDGISLDRSMSDTEFTEFIYQHYSMVLFGLEPFMPESDDQLPIVQYLCNTTSFDILSETGINLAVRSLNTVRYCSSDKFNRNLYLTLITACANGLKDIVEYLSPKIEQSDSSFINGKVIFYPIEYALLYRQLHIVEYLKDNRPKENINWAEFTVINQTGDIETLSLYQRLWANLNNNSVSFELQTKKVAIPKNLNVNSRYLQYILNYDNGQYLKYFTESYLRNCKQFSMSNVKIYLECEYVLPSSKQLFMKIVMSNWVESGSLQLIKQIRNYYPSLNGNNTVN